MHKRPIIEGRTPALIMLHVFTYVRYTRRKRPFNSLLVYMHASSLFVIFILLYISILYLTTMYVVPFEEKKIIFCPYCSYEHPNLAYK